MMYSPISKYLAISAAVIALLSPSAKAQAPDCTVTPPKIPATSITVYAPPSLANAASDLVSDFLNASNDTVNSCGTKGLGYNVSLQIMADTDAHDAIVAGAGPDLFLSQTTALPTDIITRGLTLDGQLIKFAKDSLVIYSSAAKVAALKSVLTAGNVDYNKLLLSTLKVSIPDPASDPYGVSAQKLLGGSSASSFYSKLLKKGIAVTAIDSVSAYGSVEYIDKVDGGTDLAFTGLSQICNAPNGTPVYEDGAKQWIVPSILGTDVQLTAVTVANSANFNTVGSTTYNREQYQELTDFVNFLSGAGKNNLVAHCYK